MSNPVFHLAFPITDIEETRRFYVDVLGCRVGREAPKWIDFDFFGHQISAHVYPDACTTAPTNPVDGDGVPVRHFGCVLTMDAWTSLRDRLVKRNTTFLIEPKIRFVGEVGEQATLFITDPSGNGLEFKAFQDSQALFARSDD